MRFSVVNLGCKVNRVESDEVAARLLARGASRAKEGAADLIVVNTCTVTGEAEKKTRKAVRRALSANDRARVVVTGCAAAIDAEGLSAISPRVEIVAKGALVARVGEIADELGGETAPGRPDTAGDSAYELGLRMGGSFPTRVGLKVQDGCNNACSFCIVHLARGPATSREADEVVAEAVSLAAAGVREIVLTGINLASYRDAVRGLGLAGLLERLLTATEPYEEGGRCRFRISSVEPADVDEALIEAMAAAEGRICRHLHLPLQSGSSKVLAEMARPYDAAAFEGIVARLRGAMPSIALSTDLIAGFPGESDADFAETLALAERCGFSRIHAFPYSRRAGTPAAERTDQVAPEVKAERARRLRALAERLRAQDFAARVGTTELALVEDGSRAMTESYYEIAAPHGARQGSLVPVELKPDGTRDRAALANAARAMRREA